MLSVVLCATTLVTMVTANRFVIPAMKFSDDVSESQSFILSNPGAASTSVTMETHVNGTMVTTDGPVTVNAQSVLEVAFTTSQIEWYLNGTELASKSMTFESIDVIGLYVIMTTPNHKEGYTAIPTDALGNEYYVSTFCDLGGYCKFAIATVEPGLTQIYIELPNGVDEVSMCVGKKTWVGADRSFNLVYPETVQIETARDLTGTYIYSNRSFSVIAGTRSMPVSDPAKMVYFYEQLAPIMKWGTEFIVQGIGMDFGSIIHITAAYRQTFVEMTGYKTVQMSAGNTLKRRLEKNVVARIKATKAVQVVMYIGITYNSATPMDYVSMTIIPAIEHYSTSYTGACGTSVSSSIQYAIKMDAMAPITATTEVTTLVPLTSYKVVTVTTSQSVSSSPNPYGGIMLCDKAAFPMAPPVTTESICTTTPSVLSHGDGIDNNCINGVDESVCYENVKVSTHVEIESTGYFSSYTKNVSFYEMLLRIQSCHMTQVELRVNDTLNYVLQISQTSILVYSCTTNCSMVGKIDDFKMAPTDNCSNIIRSYWILQYNYKLCINYGHFNPFGHCDFEPLNLDAGVSQMRLSGLTGDAIFWYDIYYRDCGKLVSDWRCHDELPNCNAYQSDLCTNDIYTTWVEQYCAKYCGKCSPDHYGRMFVFVPPPIEISPLNVPQLLMVAGSEVNSSKIGIDTDFAYIDTYNLIVNTHDPLFLNATFADVSQVWETIRIFAETDVTVSYIYGNKNYQFVQPIDALGSEYMTIDFNDQATNGSDLTCVFATVYPNTVLTSFTEFSYAEYNSSFTQKFLSSERTGSIVTGSQPFSAWCGTGNQSTYGVTWYQLPATNTWGTYYLVPSLGDNVAANVRSKVRIVTNSNGTAFTITGDFDGIYELHARGDFMDFDLNPGNVTIVESNFPVAVAVIYYDDMDYTKSSVHFIPPVESFAEDPLVLLSFQLTDTWSSVTSSSNVTTIEEELLQYYNNDTWQTYYYYQSNDTNNSFILSYTQSPDSFTITPSTYQFKDMTWGRICQLRNVGYNDGFDDDCDGLVDEEPHCAPGYAMIKADYDLDGNFEEDCRTSGSGISWASPPAHPVCEYVQSENFACSVWCQCKCSWKDDLENYEAMTDEEKAAYNEAQVAPLKEAMKIDKSSLSSSIAERESADDERQSSQSIGFVGVLLICLIIFFICAFDIITLFQKIRSKFSKTKTNGVAAK